MVAIDEVRLQAAHQVACEPNVVQPIAPVERIDASLLADHLFDKLRIDLKNLP